VTGGEGRGEFLHGLGRLQDCRVRFHFTTRCQALGQGQLFSLEYWIGWNRQKIRPGSAIAGRWHKETLRIMLLGRLSMIAGRVGWGCQPCYFFSPLSRAPAPRSAFVRSVPATRFPAALRIQRATQEMTIYEEARSAYQSEPQAFLESAFTRQFVLRSPGICRNWRCRFQVFAAVSSPTVAVSCSETERRDTPRTSLRGGAARGLGGSSRKRCMGKKILVNHGHLIAKLVA